MSVSIVPTLDMERAIAASGYDVIVGFDEVGRGSLAGPVMVGAAAIRTCDLSGPSPLAVPDGVADSKMLTEHRREAIFEELKSWCASWAVGWSQHMRRRIIWHCHYFIAIAHCQPEVAFTSRKAATSLPTVCHPPPSNHQAKHLFHDLLLSWKPSPKPEPVTVACQQPFPVVNVVHCRMELYPHAEFMLPAGVSDCLSMPSPVCVQHLHCPPCHRRTTIAISITTNDLTRMQGTWRRQLHHHPTSHHHHPSTNRPSSTPQMWSSTDDAHRQSSSASIAPWTPSAALCNWRHRHHHPDSRQCDVSRCQPGAVERR